MSEHLPVLKHWLVYSLLSTEPPLVVTAEHAIESYRRTGSRIEGPFIAADACRGDCEWDDAAVGRAARALCDHDGYDWGGPADADFCEQARVALRAAGETP